MLRNIVGICSAKATAAPAETSKKEALARLYKHLREKLAIPSPSGEVLDQVAQMLEDTVGTLELEKLVAEELKPKVVTESMCKRLKLLDEIPFRAILTTNYDELLTGSTPLDPRVEEWPEYCEVLRGSGASEVMYSKPEAFGSADKYAPLEKRKGRPIIKLHGRAKDAAAGEARFGGQHSTVQALVMTRTGYRKLLHNTPGYGLFVSSLLSTFTVLYMGFSFSDGYLNELRGEVLSMLFGPPSAALDTAAAVATAEEARDLFRPGGAQEGDMRIIGYAIINDKKPEEKAFFKRHEGVEILTWDTESAEGFAGLENYLQAIKEQTSFAYRVGKALAGKRGLVLAHATPSAAAVGSDGIGGAPSSAKKQFDDTIGRIFTEATKVYGGSEDGSAFDVVDQLDTALDKLGGDDCYHVIVTVFGRDVKGRGRHAWWELTKRMRSLPMARRAPIIVVNWSLTDHEQRRALCLSNGASSFISNQSELISALTSLFSGGSGGSGTSEYVLMEDVAPFPPPDPANLAHSHLPEEPAAACPPCFAHAQEQLGPRRGTGSPGGGGPPGAPALALSQCQAIF